VQVRPFSLAFISRLKFKMVRVAAFVGAVLFLASARAGERKAVALVTNPINQMGILVKGEVTFTQSAAGCPVFVEIDISGLKPNQNHGFHIHEKGDIVTNGCTSTGDHFNPLKAVHGGPMDKIRHVGDLGNVKTDADGKVTVKFVDSFLSLTSGENNILGRAVVIHEAEDDLGKGKGELQAGSLKTGNAGGRLACGVIGIQHPVEPWYNSAPQAGQVIRVIAVVLLAALSPLLLV
jgi:superoxide dismutase, Cu-Zn family